MARISRSFWSALHNLSSQESDLIRRFKADASGPLAVAVADLLRKRGYLDEAIVILEDSVKLQPNYATARAALGKDYFGKGLMNESLAQIEAVTSRSPDNLMAQRLRLRLSLVLDDKSQTQKTLRVLRQLAPDDEFTRATRQALERDDWTQARNVMFAELRRLGVPGNWSAVTAPALEDGHAGADGELSSPLLPKPWDMRAISLHPEVEGQGSLALSAPGTEAYEGEDVSVVALDVDLARDTGHKLPAAFASGVDLAHLRGDGNRYLPLKGFRPVNSPGLFSRQFGAVRGGRTPGIEARTLAEIYVTQGMVDKALVIYEKLHKERPGDSSLEARVRSLRDLVSGRAPREAGLPPARGEFGDALTSFPTDGSRESEVTRVTGSSQEMTFSGARLSAAREARAAGWNTQAELEFDAPPPSSTAPEMGMEFDLPREVARPVDTARDRKLLVLRNLLEKLEAKERSRS